MNTGLKHFIIGVLVLGMTAFLISSWVGSAAQRYEERLVEREKEEEQTAIAAASDKEYCTPTLKKILKRVLTSCGLVREGGGQGRGCQPLEAKKVAAMAGEDFNALFKPLADRAAIIQYDVGESALDESANRLLETQFANRQGASYYLVVARASPEGPESMNRELSRARAEAVLNHLKAVFKEPNIEKEVGLLWLGEEFAQLEVEFCEWNRSRSDQPCDEKALNRSAFAAWIECRL